MPAFTIDLPQRAVDRLQALVQRTNDANGTALTLRDWLTVHLKELAIADDLAATVQQLQEQHERDARDALHAAARTARDALIADLDATTPNSGGQP